MGSVARMSRPYLLALEKNWEDLGKFFDDHGETVVFPLTFNKDKALHIAVHSGKKELLEVILKKEPYAYLMSNGQGNTALHEVATTEKVELAEFLLNYEEKAEHDDMGNMAQDFPGFKDQKLIEIKNNLGETPLFRAAAFGRTKMVRTLLSHIGDMEPHRRRKDSTTILHIAVLGKYFETALQLLEKDPELGTMKDESGFTCLQLLANMPSAFKSGYSMGILKRILYFCVPSNVEDKEDKNHRANDADIYKLDDAYKGNSNGNLQRGLRLPPTYAVCEDLYFMIMLVVTSALRKLNLLIWRLLCQGWQVMERTWNEKRQHEAALRLAKLLIRTDISWELSSTSEDKSKISVVASQEDKTEHHQTNPREVMPEEERGKDKGKVETTTPPTSLLIATGNGIVEIVKEILAVYPQAVEHISDKGQNILNVAIKHRQKEILSLVKKMEIPMARLVRRIDNNGYSILHHVGLMEYYSGGTLPGPALQLQEELHWFERVQKIIPPHYAMHRSNKKETAQEFFKRTHEKLLKEAQEWLKRTSESCSTVAVLIATVAFAAAYTVPGGSNQDTGLPILLHDPFFLVFTVMDVLSLASSLTSVVMFLSILTSPFQLQDFRYSLPRKLTLGFTFLFFSVAATMLSFAATILLIIHLKKRWTTLLIYSVAFFPVTIFALLQFPLYLAFMGTLKTSIRAIKKAFPWHFIPRLF